MYRPLVILGSTLYHGEAFIGASDRAAAGLAVRRFSGPTRGVCPSEDDEARNYAIAAGISSVQWFTNFDSLNFDVALIGSGALTRYGDGLAGTLAEQRNATLIFDVLDFQVEGSRFKVVKDVGRGNREEWIVNGPVVLVISADAVRPPYVSWHRRRLVSNVAFHTNTNRNDFPLIKASDWEAVRPRVKQSRQLAAADAIADERMSAAFGITAPSSQSNDRVIIADAASCARHLLRYLAHHGFISRSVDQLDTPHETDRAKPQTFDPHTTADEPLHLASRILRRPKAVGESSTRRARSPRPSQPDKPMAAWFARRPRSLNNPSANRRRGPRRVPEGV